MDCDEDYGYPLRSSSLHGRYNPDGVLRDRPVPKPRSSLSRMPHYSSTSSLDQDLISSDMYKIYDSGTSVINNHQIRVVNSSFHHQGRVNGKFQQNKRPPASHRSSSAQRGAEHSRTPPHHVNRHRDSSAQRGAEHSRTPPQHVNRHRSSSAQRGAEHSRTPPHRVNRHRDSSAQLGAEHSRTPPQHVNHHRSSSAQRGAEHSRTPPHHVNRHRDSSAQRGAEHSRTPPQHVNSHRSSSAQRGAEHSRTPTHHVNSYQDSSAQRGAEHSRTPTHHVNRHRDSSAQREAEHSRTPTHHVNRHRDSSAQRGTEHSRTPPQHVNSHRSSSAQREAEHSRTPTHHVNSYQDSAAQRGAEHSRTPTHHVNSYQDSSAQRGAEHSRTSPHHVNSYWDSSARHGLGRDQTPARHAYKEGSSRNFEHRPIAYKQLEYMVNEESLNKETIALRLSTESSGFSLRLKDMHDGFVQLILKLFAKLCQDDEPNLYLTQILLELLTSDFQVKIMKFLSSKTLKNEAAVKNFSIHLRNTVSLMRAWLLHAQNAAKTPIDMLLPFVKAKIPESKVENYEDINEIVQEVEEMLASISKKPQKTIRPDRNELALMHEETPPDDFRQIAVFPTEKDIHDPNPFVRINLTTQAYLSTDHYLDVQFRLLREDFVRPLREGIGQYLQSSKLKIRNLKRRLEGVKIYQDVTIEFPKLGHKGISYCLRFNVDHLKFVQWQNSKRLIFGNLICLSSDNFTKNFLFASITNREVDQLQNGYIEAEFWNSDSGVNHEEEDDDEEEKNDELEEGARQQRGVSCSALISPIDMRKTYVMAESEAYFEAYRHVLAGLQETQDIPLRQYIVECRKWVDSPRYLRNLGRVANYDFSCIIQKDEDDDLPEQNVYDVLDRYNWPSARLLGLDPSQVEALKSALTNELSIIQGPPGTGKTYVGLMIMKILLTNRTSEQATAIRRVQPQQKTVPGGPILVVCYTNHALDQFLEGIAKFHPEGLVRLGGRSKNRELEKYKLSNLRRNVTSDKFTRSAFFELRRDLDTLVNEVEELQDILKASVDSILSLNILESVIAEGHLEQLKGLNVEADDVMLNWLGLMKKAHRVSEFSFIVEEPLEALAQGFYAKYEMPRSSVFHAINCSGQMFPDGIMHCYNGHLHDSTIEPYVHPDIVCNHLLNLHLDKEVLGLLAHRYGFTELEVKCALFVLQFYWGEGNVPPEVMVDWLRKKKALEENDDLEEDVVILEEEAAIVEDGRMIDEGSDVFMQIDRKKTQRRGKPPKKIVAAKRDELSISHVDEDGFQLPRHEMKKKRKELMQCMKKEMNKTDCMNKRQAEAVMNIFSLSTEQKWKLYRYWVGTLVERNRDQLNKRAVRYNKLTKALNDLRNRESLEVLKKSDVVAMTTTGAAKYRDMIYELPVRIVIVEEAAEVLEAHIVTSMPKTTQHLILIGDHQQLKPSPTVYELAKRYELDMSLFERMVKNGIPCSRLELQHRMRPRIADLLRPHIYETLRDHSSVESYGDVLGVQSNIYFLSHDHLEDNVIDSKSKVNQHEADFMIGLCRYLLLQGYEPDQITILTAYVGQLLAFKKALAQKLDKRIRITAVDNFQGEENEIILLSLVRSNEEGKIGFLSIENRVCVALSRAKKGLYCIGNFELLKQKSGLWKTIITQLERDGLSGTSLPLQCQNDKTVTMVECLEDFKKVPEGGCGKPCNARLDCGHACTRLCHPDDREHILFRCVKKCNKTCERGHVSSVPCHKELRCIHPCTKTIPKCGHATEVLCSQEPDKVICKVPCEKLLSCGHKCDQHCGVKCTTQCKAQVKITSPCGHQVKVPCHERSDFNVLKCPAECSEILKCGHLCKGTCGRCMQGRLHIRCSHSKCSRVLCCGHLCEEMCTSMCPPCQKDCETACVHSECPKKCSVPCKLCKEKCNWKCDHYNCTKLCSEPCDRPPCNEPCQKLLPCNHPCIGLCGEPCPKLCRVCNKEEVEEIFFGDEDEEDARFVELDCGHIFTYQNLDTWMEQTVTDENTATDIKLNECPRCKTPIRRSTRYGNVVNKTLMMINEVRMKIAGTFAEIKSNRLSLLDAISSCNTSDPFHHRISRLASDAKRASSNLALEVVETRYNCLKQFNEIKTLLVASSPDRLKTKLNENMDRIVNWLLRKRSFYSEQESEDLKEEIQRCKDALKLIQLKSKISSADSSLNGHVECIAKQVFTIFPYSSHKQEAVADAFKKIKRLRPHLMSELGISDEERKMILSAFNLSRGHWFKCKNGHVYCIGECGGAMEESKCPECDAVIGGTSHRLDSSNQLASEMDGAERPTWDPNTFVIPPDLI